MAITTNNSINVPRSLLGPVEAEDIVKGFETDDDEYVMLEPEEIENIKLPSSDTLALENFVDLCSIPVARFERPYFVLPEGKDAAEIYAIMRALAARGKAILMVSSELPELIAVCDRIAVCREGTIASTLDNADATEESIMQVAIS